MGKFKRRPLGVVDRIYGFTGASSQVAQVALEVPITMVHDVSREAEYGSGIGQNNGFFWWQNDLTHAGAGVLRTFQDPMNAAIYGGISSDVAEDRRRLNVWFLRHYIEATAVANLTTVSVALVFPAAAYPYSPNEAVIPLGLYRGGNVSYVQSIANSTATGDRTMMIRRTVTGEDWTSNDLERPPLFVPDGGVITMRSDATGVGVVRLFSLWWVGAKGALPPGLP